jgi:hypothetical protein
MIKSEHPFNNKENLIKHYSDEGNYIIQNETGRKYRIAVDVYPCRYTYTETSEKAPPVRSYAEILALREKFNG